MDEHCDYCNKELITSEERELGVCLACQESTMEWMALQHEIRHILKNTIPVY